MSYGNRVWTIPTTIPPADNYKIKISCLATPTIYDYSAYFTISNPSGTDDPSITPLITGLAGNYPNPFKTDTTINFSVKETSDLNLAVYDVKGRLVKQLLKLKTEPGSFSATWDGTDGMSKPVQTGVYFLQMKADSYHFCSKLMLIR